MTDCHDCTQLPGGLCWRHAAAKYRSWRENGPVSAAEPSGVDEQAPEPREPR